MEVAKVCAVECGRVAAGSVGHDVTAFVVHNWSPSGGVSPSPPNWQILLVKGIMRGGGSK